MKSESFRKQALCLVLFFAAVAAVFALTRLRSDPAKKQAEFVVQQLSLIHISSAHTSASSFFFMRFAPYLFL